MPDSSLPPVPTPDGVRLFAQTPAVLEGLTRVREAMTGLRWHEGLRRRTAEAAAESRVRGAVASAGLEGAELAGSENTLPLMRDLMRGATSWPEQPGPVEQVARAASRVTAATEAVAPAQLRAPAQVLVRLHIAAAADLVPREQVGRPRSPDDHCGELADLGPAPAAELIPGRLSGIAALLGVEDPTVPRAVVAAMVHAEIAAVRPFVTGNALVARAMERAVLRATGVDPTGVAVPEAGHRSVPGPSYLGALSGYLHGSGEGLMVWWDHWVSAMVAGADAGTLVADAVRLGRTS